MKLLHSTTTMLSTKEFNKLTDKIADALYELSPDIQDIYDIHINYIADAWEIDFVPLVDNIPTIKVNSFADQDDHGREVLRVIPINLSDLPGILKFKDSDKSYDLCVTYVVIFEFIIALYDFEYRLN